MEIFNQVCAIACYYLEKLLLFTILLTVILAIKVDITLELFMLLLAQCLELSTTNIFIRFPAGLDVREHYKLLTHVFYLIFLLSQGIMITACTTILTDYNVGTKEYALVITILSRSIIVLIGFMAMFIATTANANFGNNMRRECRKLMQILHTIYPIEPPIESIF